MENHDANSHIEYLRNKMDMINFLTYIHFQHKSSWQNVLVGSDIVLQLLVSEFLTVILIFHFLSLIENWTTVAVIMTKQKE